MKQTIYAAGAFLATSSLLCVQAANATLDPLIVTNITNGALDAAALGGLMTAFAVAITVIKRVRGAR